MSGRRVIPGGFFMDASRGAVVMPSPRRGAAVGRTGRAARVGAGLAAACLATALGLSGCSGGNDADGKLAAGAATPSGTGSSPSGDRASKSSKPAVPAPGGGSIKDEVEVKPAGFLPPASLGAAVRVDKRVSVEVTDAKVIKGKARLPGEIAGRAVAVTVRAHNRSEEPVKLAGVTVMAEDRRETPLSQLGGRPARPMKGRLRPGASTDGVYVFTLPAPNFNPLTVFVHYRAQAPIATFVGDLK